MADAGRPGTDQSAAPSPRSSFSRAESGSPFGANRARRMMDVSVTTLPPSEEQVTPFGLRRGANHDPRRTTRIVWAGLERFEFGDDVHAPAGGRRDLVEIWTDLGRTLQRVT